ncbi:hypothetical protein GCM10020367_31570 [Streptomyces sannanensis]|uniref:Uncharacterized protein n=1 Tax=Streptomyces sannanensis TaxID=285536 RepID=A0ABP6SCD3_9ACTN
MRTEMLRPDGSPVRVLVVDGEAPLAELLWQGRVPDDGVTLYDLTTPSGTGSRTPSPRVRRPVSWSVPRPCRPADRRRRCCCAGPWGYPPIERSRELGERQTRR